jgi:glycosyltransferase involved in cell wall biosynthesis
VLVAAYNGEAFIGEALASLSAQTCGDFEAIVVDDGSTDATASIAAAAAARDERFRLIRQDNGGTQVARNTALAAARGTWAALLDQDDVWLPDKLAAQLAIASAYPTANLLFTNYRTWDGAHVLGTRNTRRDRFPDGGRRRRARTQLPVPGFDRDGAARGRRRARRIRSEASERGGLGPVLRLASRGIEARGVFEPLVLYRVWGGNESRDHERTAAERVAMLEKALGRTQPTPLRKACQRWLQHARAQLALARAAKRLDDPAFVRASLREALAHDPSAKRLLEWLAVSLPGTAKIVHAKLARKFE